MALLAGHHGVQLRSAAHLGRPPHQRISQRDLQTGHEQPVPPQPCIAQSGVNDVQDHSGALDREQRGEMAYREDLEELRDGVSARMARISCGEARTSSSGGSEAFKILLHDAFDYARIIHFLQRIVLDLVQPRLHPECGIARHDDQVGGDAEALGRLGHLGQE